MTNKTEINVYMPSRDPDIFKLNPKENLSDIREKLNIHLIYSFIDRSSGSFVKREHEAKKKLEDIIEERDLYLEMYPWKFLVEEHKLEFGRIIDITNGKFKIAEKAAFTAKDCKMTLFEDNSGNIPPFSTHLNENWKDLFLTADNNNKDIKESRFVTYPHTMVHEYHRLTLNLQLEPTPEFIKEVVVAINSKEHRNFKGITEKFGQFIPTEVILGGREYDHKDSDNDLFESLKDLRKWKCIKFKNPIRSIFRLLEKGLREEILKLIGKKILYMENTVNPGTVSLKPISCKIPEKILKFVQNNKEADCSLFATVVGKENVKNVTFNCQIFERDEKLKVYCIQKGSKERNCKLEIRWMVIGYDINFDFESNFNGQLEVRKFEFNASGFNIDQNFNLTRDPALCFGMPKLNELEISNNYLTIGHHFFNENGQIGFCTFYYDFKEAQYINNDSLNFNFYILFISNCPKSDGDIFPFKHNNRNKLPNFTGSKFTRTIKPKFISLYSNGHNKCRPMFLKQKINRFKIKYINGCDEGYIGKKFCKSDKLKYAFFDFNYQGISFH
ncbi:unnamed protein product [Rhizophagus irregularis]|uniref:DUF7431 domain-containing protein n=1 Tax=Rhizophagus irregularis TaxID=588596 RepID=A0A916EES5_9GLOM|nr:unnamed protein product [Rhizophagus irregularis]CAB5376817.1 unnamed protein product [Rhizophagus irregularis]